MKFGILILPLIGGFWFVTQFNRTYYQASKSNSTALYLTSALAAVILLFIGKSTELLLARFLPQCFEMLNKGVNLYLHDGNGLMLVISFVVGIISPFFFNLFYKKEATNIYLIQKYGSEFQRLVVDTVISDKDPFEQLMQFNLKSGKVYIGLVERADSKTIDEDWEDVRIIPFLSGYRDKENHRLFITEEYFSWFDSKETEDYRKYIKTINLSEISYSGLFDLEIFINVSSDDTFQSHSS